MGDDNMLRGQTTVLGAILVFGILVTSLSIFQVYIVPNQNADVELAHQDVVDEDFTRFHSGLMNAAAQNGEHTASFRLGTTYPERLVTLNPPNPQGTLSVSSIGTYDTAVANLDDDPSDETLADICGISPGTDINSLRYTPDYNELRNVPENGYENAITYKQYGDEDDQQFVEYNQQLVDGNVLRIRPLIGDTVSTSETGTESIEFYAGSTGVVSLSENEEITLPTELSEDQWEEIASNGNLYVSNYGGDTVTLTLDGDFTVRCTPIGVQEEPDNDPEFTPGDGPGEGDYLNPVGEGVLEFEDITSSGSKSYDIQFLSNSEAHTVTKVRVAASSAPGTSGKEVKLGRDEDSVTLTVGGEFKSVDNEAWSWGDGEIGEPVELNEGDNNKLNLNTNQKLTVQFIFEDGTISQYEIDVGSS